MKLTKLEKETIVDVCKHVFTFVGEFATYRQGVRVLKRLTDAGYLEKMPPDEYGRIEYRATDAARDFVKYGVLIGDWNASQT